ncbi:hypothetical protein CTheo_8370 [Ceratobasidium theobromae]|uniref:Uncharacterized protein n=1 Tax=Ceratobasidium theobromae TaxID=1582974 RepID=A0A5N5Q8S7_9AGAM|nr:hypothetical protein CTheo_8370 [Ceratobasidium theobromae]
MPWTKQTTTPCGKEHLKEMEAWKTATTTGKRARKAKGTSGKGKKRRVNAFEVEEQECCLWTSTITNEKNYEFYEETLNRDVPGELKDRVYLRAMNRWAFVNKDGMLISPKHKDLSHTGAYLIGWATTLSGGQRRVQRIMSGYWPPKENRILSGLGSVWRMEAAVLLVPVGEIFFEDVENPIMNFAGVWVSSADKKAHYLLQNPLTQYENIWSTVLEAIDLDDYMWEDAVFSRPRPDWMSPWVAHMTRMELSLPATHDNDKLVEEPEPLGASDAESIEDDDSVSYPTGSSWRSGDPYGLEPTWLPALAKQAGALSTQNPASGRSAPSEATDTPGSPSAPPGADANTDDDADGDTDTDADADADDGVQENATAGNGAQEDTVTGDGVQENPTAGDGAAVGAGAGVPATGKGISTSTEASKSAPGAGDRQTSKANESGQAQPVPLTSAPAGAPSTTNKSVAPSCNPHAVRKI